MKKRLVSVLGTLALAITAVTATTPQAPAAVAALDGPVEVADRQVRSSAAPATPATPATPGAPSEAPLAAVAAPPAHSTKAPARPVPTVEPRVEVKVTPRPAAPKAVPEQAPQAVPTVQEARSYALRKIGSAQYRCLNLLWTKESNWNPRATNPSSGAYGIPQSLPAGKMAKAGADWRTNPVTQVRWGLGYISGRYGTACAAWQHSQEHNWY